MKNKIIALAVSFFFSSVALADEPLKSIDQFEKDINQCLLKNKKPAPCLGNTMQGHFSPGNENLNEVVKKLEGVFGQWLGNNQIFAVYPVKKKALDSFYEERVYILENNVGRIVMLETAFVKTLGQWYLHRFNLTGKSENMQKVLGVDI